MDREGDDMADLHAIMDLLETADNLFNHNLAFHEFVGHNVTDFDAMSVDSDSDTLSIADTVIDPDGVREVEEALEQFAHWHYDLAFIQVVAGAELSDSDTMTVESDPDALSVGSDSDSDTGSIEPHHVAHSAHVMDPSAPWQYNIGFIHEFANDTDSDTDSWFDESDSDAQRAHQ